MDIDVPVIPDTHQMGDQRYAPECTSAEPPGVVVPPNMEWPCRVVTPSQPDGPADAHSGAFNRRF